MFIYIYVNYNSNALTLKLLLYSLRVVEQINYLDIILPLIF